jgi:hypothetical protein
LKRSLAAVLTLLALSAMGCEHHFFQVKGSIGSDGGVLGAWHSKPEGCSLAPVDGLPAGKSSTVATLIWPDPLAMDQAREKDRAVFLNVPLQLNLLRTGDKTVADLTTLHFTEPTRLDAGVCSTLAVSTQQGKPAFPGARPTLDGSLKLDCQVEDSHVKADLHFSGCEF